MFTECSPTSYQVPLRDVVLNPENWEQPRWRSLYGAPVYLEAKFNMPGSRQSKLHRRMNMGLIEGSSFRGLLLYSAAALPEHENFSGRRRGITSAEEAYQLQRWNVVVVEVVGVELYQLEEGPDGMVMVCVTCGNSKQHSKWVRSRPGMAPLGGDAFALFLQRLQFHMKLPKDVQVVGQMPGEGYPDIFVEVWWKGRGALGGARRRVAFVRYPVSKLYPKTKIYDASRAPEANEGPAWPQEGWLVLTSDALAQRGSGSTSLRHVRPIGVVLTRMMIQEPQSLGDESDSDFDMNDSESEESDEEKPLTETNLLGDEEEERVRVPRNLSLPISPYNQQLFRIKVHIYQAVGLPPSDPNGSSDPFVVVRIGSRQTRTQVVPKTLMPGYFASCEFVVELPVYMPTRSGDPALKAAKVAGANVTAEPREGEGMFGGPKKRVVDITALGRGITDDLRQAVQPDPTGNDKVHKYGFVAGQDTEIDNGEFSGGDMDIHKVPALPEASGEAALIPFSRGPTDYIENNLDASDDDDDVSETSEISSTLSYIRGSNARAEGRVMWWAAPMVHLTVMDADRIRSDDPLATTSFFLQPPSSEEQPPIPREPGMFPQWHDLRAFNSTKPGGRILVATEVQHALNAENEKYGREEGDSTKGGDSDEEGVKVKKPVINSYYGKSLLYTFTPERANMLSQGGAGVSRLHLPRSQTIPVQLDLVIASLRDLKAVSKVPSQEYTLLLYTLFSCLSASYVYSPRVYPSDLVYTLLTPCIPS
jgi:hypothetical protein